MRNFKIKSGIIFPITLALLISFFGFTYLSPSHMYFRSWEYFDDFVYPGFKEGRIVMRESGDSSRGYLFQRYKTKNEISVNEFGNRESFFGDSDQYDVLAVGDSQLFGSGVSDRETFPSQLNLFSRYNVYNASRVNGFSILNSSEIRGQWKYIIISSTERNGFSNFCIDSKFQLPKSNPIHLQRKTIFSYQYLIAYLRRVQGWVDQKYSSIISGRILAPSDRIITTQHSFDEKNFQADLNCVTVMDSEIREYGLTPIFLLFPSNQSLYPEDSPLLPNIFTLNYISQLSKVGSERGIALFDSIDCLRKSKKVVSQTHDTHLNAAGYKALAVCMASFMDGFTSP
jgi:hypothetical protein